MIIYKCRKQLGLLHLHNEAEHFAIVGRLSEQTRQLRMSFSRLTMATVKSLISLRITPAQLLGALEPNIAKECQQSSTILAIFSSLCTHSISFFNYGLLEQIISKFEDQNVRKKLEDYKTAIESYCKNPLRQLPPNALANVDQNQHANLVQLCIKLDAEWHTATCKDIREFQKKLASVLEIKEEVLNLCSVEEGCIMAKFLILRSFAEEIFRNGLSDIKQQALESINVIHIECGAYYMWMSKYPHPKKAS